MPLRPFCRNEKNGHVCHRMAGHAGPHIERHHQNEHTDITWWTPIQYGVKGVVA